jgi:hypothetical protein
MGEEWSAGNSVVGKSGVICGLTRHGRAGPCRGSGESTAAGKSRGEDRG